MELKNCLRCRKVFPKIKDPICDSCKKEEELMFKKVKDYLDDNRDSSIVQISEATGISSKKILSYLRDGRIEISAAEGELACRMCGASITSGQYCNKCQVEIGRQISDMKKESSLNSAKGIGMHTKRR